MLSRKCPMSMWSFLNPLTLHIAWEPWTTQTNTEEKQVHSKPQLRDAVLGSNKDRGR